MSRYLIGSVGNAKRPKGRDPTSGRSASKPNDVIAKIGTLLNSSPWIPEPTPAGPPNTVGLALQIEEIQPQINRIDTDGKRRKSLFINVLHLRLSEFICG
jgi:hypothetical protein